MNWREVLAMNYSEVFKIEVFSASDERRVIEMSKQMGLKFEGRPIQGKHVYLMFVGTPEQQNKLLRRFQHV